MTSDPQDVRGDLLKFLGPSLLVTLLNQLLKDSLGLWFQIPAICALIIWMVWAASRSPYLTVVTRIALPIVALAYGTVLVVFSIFRHSPREVTIALSASIWAVAGMVIFRLISHESRRSGVLGYCGVAVSGLGVAVVGDGFTNIVIYQRFSFGVSAIFMGMALVGVGVTLVVRDRRWAGAMLNVWGLAVSGVGVASCFERDQWSYGFAAALESPLLAIFGATVVVAGSALFRGNRRLGGFATCAVGVALICYATAIGFSAIVVGLWALGYGVAAAAVGIGLVVTGHATRISHERLARTGGVVVGVGLLAYGTESSLLTAQDIAFGCAVAGLGLASIVAAILFTERGSRPENLSATRTPKPPKRHQPPEVRRHRRRSLTARTIRRHDRRHPTGHREPGHG